MGEIVNDADEIAVQSSSLDPQMDDITWHEYTNSHENW